MEHKIKVIIVDDHGLVREAFCSMLSGLPSVDVLDSVASGEEAIAVTTKKQPDVVLMDIVMRGMSGIEATRWIKEQNPTVKVILLSSEVNKELIRDGIKSGLDGYMHKDSSKDEVLMALQCVMRGQRYLSKEITDIVLNGLEESNMVKKRPSHNSGELTKRENEILKLIALGKSIKEIADELFISTRTVETHKLNVQSKLNLVNTAQLVRYAIENKII
jgi:DNA-binding NarL/FixJ family response regulator